MLQSLDPKMWNEISEPKARHAHPRVETGQVPPEDGNLKH